MPGKRFSASNMLRTGQARSGDEEDHQAHPVAEVAPVAPTRRAAPRRLRPIKLDGELVDEAVRAVWFLMTHDQPTATLKSLTERALRTELQRLQDEYNDGQPFPDKGPLPAGGRAQLG